MFARQLLAVILFLLSLAGAYEYEIVPNQTAAAKATLDKMTSKAKILSDAARAKVIAYFDDKTFRSEIDSLKTIKNYTAEHLREWFVGNVKKTNVIVTFPTSVFDNILKAGHVFNKWQLMLAGQTYPAFSLTLAEYAETKLMGFPPMANIKKPTEAEADTRPLYFAVNIWKKANGNPMYGDTNFVAHPSRKKNFLLLPSDSGWWYKACIAKHPTTPPVDCTKYTALDATVGTFDNFDHLILTHNAFYKYPISDLFKRFYNNSYAKPPADVNYYYEADMAAAFYVPQHVWYTILDWIKLWGIAQGKSVQAWHKNVSRPLVWSGEVNHMFLDATVGFFTGYNVTSRDVSDVATLWAPPKDAEAWYTLYNKISDGLHLYPLREEDCGDGYCGSHCDYLGTNSLHKCLYTGYK